MCGALNRENTNKSHNFEIKLEKVVILIGDELTPTTSTMTGRMTGRPNTGRVASTVTI